ncbi:MAG: HlyD family efflux transporter periplasmic adaptor subunit [bacterium]
MDRKLSTEIIRKRKLKRLAAAAAVIVLLLVSYFALGALLQPSLDLSKIRTSIAARGSIEATISASGVVVPEFEHVITAPTQTRIDSLYLRAGDPVAQGQSILKLNQDELRLDFDRVRDELDLQKTRKQQLVLKLEQNQADLEASYEIKSLQLRYMQTNLERERKLFAAGASNETIVEQAELDYEICNRELKLLSVQVENQQASLQAELRVLDLEIRIRESDLAEISRKLELAEAKVEQAGVVTWINDNVGSVTNVGEVIARVADLSSYKVEARISDIHADELQVGCSVRVRIAETTLSGRISSVEPSVENGVASFVVELDENDHQLLRPNLRVDVFVVTAYKDNVIRVANGPFYYGSRDQQIFVVEGDKAIRKTVTIGESNYDYVELDGDIQPGDEVIISDMRDYKHLKQISLKHR